MIPQTFPVAIKLDDPRAMPFRAHPNDAGADLFSTVDKMIYPGDMHLIDTGVALKIPTGFVGLVTPRSSQGKIKVFIANTVGVIDPAYRGNIMVRLLNEGEDPYEINKYATRIAQLLIVPVFYPDFRIFDESITGTWDDTVRSTGGFGSTGGV
jgi:dUTP pyrophosphatase